MYSLDKLEEKIGYCFQNKNLLKQAMTHSSYTNEQKINQLENYERVEFLGDAVLELVASEFMYLNHPTQPEGKLTKMRASAVCEQALALAAKEIEIGQYMLFGKGEESTGGRERESIIADAVEATIGGIFLDGGLEPAKTFILRFVLNDLEKKQLFYDSKSILQEMVQSKKMGDLNYELVDEHGPDHEKSFSVVAKIGNRIIGIGNGRTKKAAEQNAAYEAIIHKMKIN